jgi:hypothetical protein
VIYVEMLVESIFWLHALNALRVRNIRKLNSVVTCHILSNYVMLPAAFIHGQEVNSSLNENDVRLYFYRQSF